jgi:hypothetical protein
MIGLRCLEDETAWKIDIVVHDRGHDVNDRLSEHDYNFKFQVPQMDHVNCSFALRRSNW